MSRGIVTAGYWQPVTSPIHRLDPRLRILMLAVLTLVTLLAQKWLVLSCLLLLALLLVAIARLSLHFVWQRLIALDAFMLFTVCLLPFTLPGDSIWVWGQIQASYQGLERALMIAIKANTLLLAALVLVGTLEITALGHALHHLRINARLTQLLLFTIRYLDLVQQEYHRLRRAMRARAFRPRSNLHTWRSIGYLFGMLLVRSLARSERILAAMKCRGFDGDFHHLRHPPAKQYDWLIGSAFFVVLLLLLCWEFAP